MDFDLFPSFARARRWAIYINVVGLACVVSWLFTGVIASAGFGLFIMMGGTAYLGGARDALMKFQLDRKNVSI